MIFLYRVTKRDNSKHKTDRNIANFCHFWKKYQGKVPFSFLPFDNCISGILYLKFEEKTYLSKNIIAKRYFCPYDTMVRMPCSVISESWKISKSFWLQYQKSHWNFIMFKFSAVSQIWKKYIQKLNDWDLPSNLIIADITFEKIRCCVSNFAQYKLIYACSLIEISFTRN